MSLFHRRVRKIRKAQLKMAENAMAAAPAHPQRRGQTQQSMYRITLRMAAIAMTLRGEIASRVASKIERETFCASAAHVILPLQSIQPALPAFLLRFRCFISSGWLGWRERQVEEEARRNDRDDEIRKNSRFEPCG